MYLSQPHRTYICVLPSICSSYSLWQLSEHVIHPPPPYLHLNQRTQYPRLTSVPIIPPAGYYRKFVALKQLNPRLKVTIAVGGWNEGSKKYSDMAKDPNKRAKFINSTIDFIT